MIFNKYKSSDNEYNQNEVIKLINTLNDGCQLTRFEYTFLLDNINEKTFAYLQKLAYTKTRLHYGNKVLIRGLIEISNYCIQDCYYCGIRKSNTGVKRYRYDKDTILKIIDQGYNRGYRTIVMQGGEDPYYNDELLCEIITTAKTRYPDIAITLSLGQRSKDSYQKLYNAHASRYLLRHESASQRLFDILHPDNIIMQERLQCLKNLKEIGFQTGAGFMVGSPQQENSDLVEDLYFIQELQPQMIGIGPYLTHPDTPFRNEVNPELDHVLICYALARLIVPKALIPSTTATSSLSEKGRLLALKSGCNVIMINLSLEDTRLKYNLYANKTYKGDESLEYIGIIENDINMAGLEIDFSIGNHVDREEINNGKLY